ncbi:MAG TPA: FGGY family carbohydrate kinase, partial [Polyangiaceae bacterium]|nr:FGGY family carbohydrate kinase [Polyangiaceae bacterium]
MGERAFVGVDVGTASVRAGVVDRNGRMLGVGVEAITVSRPSEDFVEQSSEEIWRACGLAIRKALQEAGVEPGAIAGLG